MIPAVKLYNHFYSNIDPALNDADHGLYMIQLERDFQIKCMYRGSENHRYEGDMAASEDREAKAFASAQACVDAYPKDQPVYIFVEHTARYSWVTRRDGRLPFHRWGFEGVQVLGRANTGTFWLFGREVTKGRFIWLSVENGALYTREEYIQFLKDYRAERTAYRARMREEGKLHEIQREAFKRKEEEYFASLPPRKPKPKPKDKPPKVDLSQYVKAGLLQIT